MESSYSQHLATAVGDAISALLAANGKPDGLQRAFQSIADATDVDRISLIEFHSSEDPPRVVTSHRFDWRHDVPDELYNDPDTASIELDASYRFWSQPMLGDSLIVTQVADADEPIRARLTAWNVQTVLSAAIDLPTGYRGALNLVHKHAPYHWTPEELVVIQTICHALAAACLRYDTDARLSSSGTLSREAFDHSTVGMVVTDADGTMLEVNDALCVMLGYARDQLIGRNTLMLAHPDDIDVVHEMRRGILDLELTDNERRFVRSDGELIWAQCNIAPLRSNNAEAGSDARTFVAQVRDITAIRQAGVIANLERSNRELEQFAYIASHDLQEPLRMITSYLELLQRRYGDQLDEDAQEFIHFAVDGAQRMRALVTSLLVYSRLDNDPSVYVPLHLSATLERALPPLRLLIEENAARITHDALPLVNGDEAQLTQVFQNLIENAIKFRSEAPPEIHVSATRESDFWIISVQDNGIGFDPSQAERIFGVFRRLHKYGQYAGTGIGLAICRRIIERHGGTIKAISDTGKGSTFQLTLPVVNA